MEKLFLVHLSSKFNSIFPIPLCLLSPLSCWVSSPNSSGNDNWKWRSKRPPCQTCHIYRPHFNAGVNKKIAQKVTSERKSKGTGFLNSNGSSQYTNYHLDHFTIEVLMIVKSGSWLQTLQKILIQKSAWVYWKRIGLNERVMCGKRDTWLFLSTWEYTETKLKPKNTNIILRDNIRHNFWIDIDPRPLLSFLFT